MKPRFRFDWRFNWWRCMNVSAFRLMGHKGEYFVIASDFRRPLSRAGVSVVSIP